MTNENVVVPKLQSKVMLSPKTKTAGEVLRENGKIWMVIGYRDRVLAFGNKPGLLVESMISQVWRWVRIENDKEFYWVPIASGRA